MFLVDSAPSNQGRSLSYTQRFPLQIIQPIVSDLNARARNGDTYRTLFLVATPQGVNPAALAQGQQTSGKIYFLSDP